MKNKRGISHLELITAMLIFLFAVVLVIYFINVGVKTESLEPVLNAIEIELRERAEVDYNKTLLYVKDLDVGVECFKVHLHSDMPTETDKAKIFIKDILFDISGTEFPITNNNQPLYEIYSFSEDVSENFLTPDGCIQLIEGPDYNYSLSYHGKMFSKEKLSNIELEYEDFKIDIYDLSIYLGKNPPQQVEVYAKDLIVDILTENGEIKEVIINIKVW